MENKQPTREMIVELWEYCGQIQEVSFVVESPLLSATYTTHKQIAFKPDLIGRENDNLNWDYFNWSRTVDLNNLFKYAVPKRQDKGDCISLIAYEGKGYGCLVTELFAPEPYCEIKHTDPTLALFWTIWEVIHGRKTCLS